MAEEFTLLDPQVVRRVLEMQRVTAASRVPAFIAHTARLDVERAMLDELVYRLSAFVLADKFVDDVYTVTVNVPASWWQHFKRDCLPQWWRNRWPVKEEQIRRRVEFMRYNTYPNASFALPEERFGKPVVYETVTPLWEQP
jgi:hypothetical protein